MSRFFGTASDSETESEYSDVEPQPQRPAQTFNVSNMNISHSSI